MWPPCRAVLRRSAPFCAAQPAGRLGRSMCSCSRHLAGSRSAGDVNQAGRKALDSSDKSSPARRAKAEEARRRRCCCCCEQGRMAGDSEQRLEEHGQPSGGEPFLIGVSGGTASGKSSVCSKIVQLLGQNEVDYRQKQVVIVSQDSFYRVLTSEQKSKALKGQFNFDHPDAFDNELIVKTLKEITEGKTVQIPVYDFVSHSRKEETVTVYPADVVLFEGILAFYSQEVRDLFRMKLFVDTDADTRLSRRVLRDISERGRDLEQILSQYITFVKPAFEEFCLPTKKYADVIIPRGADNEVAINLIVQHIQDILNGGLSKRQSNGYLNGYTPPRQRQPSESSSRPH